MSDLRAEPAEVRGTLGTVRNAVKLLDLLADGPAYQQLTDLADRSGLSVPTAHRLLRSLVLADLVEQDTRSSRYSLGPEVTRLSQRYLGRLPILGALSPYLVSLRDTLQTTIHVAVLVRESVVYVDRVDAGDGGPYRDSHRVTDALATSAGRLLASRASEDLWEQCVAAHPGPLDGDPTELREAWSRAPHLAAHDELAVVVHDAVQNPVAALATTVPPGADAARLEAIATHLARAAVAAGRAVGHA